MHVIVTVFQQLQTYIRKSAGNLWYRIFFPSDVVLLPPCKLEHPKLLPVLRDIGIAISVQLTIFLNLLAHITVVTNSVMYHTC